MPTVIQQTWERSETSWLKNLDGVSLHKTPEDHSAFLKGVKDVEEFFRPIGPVVTLEILQDLYDQVEETGVWIGEKDMKKLRLQYRHKQGEEKC
jgi:hypothetical protein